MHFECEIDVNFYVQRIDSDRQNNGPLKVFASKSPEPVNIYIT